MPYTAEIFTSSIVALGDFNPAIFSPDWFERNNLIGQDDAQTARDGKQLIVSHTVTVLETEWFALQVLEGQLTMTSKGVLSPAFRDLAIGIFQLVPHTPVRAAGLNFMGDFKLASEDEYHKIGDTLAPKNIWNELCSDDEHSVGLASLTIRVQHGKRGEKLLSQNEKRISVQPSNRFRIGVFLSYNDHHELKGDFEEGLRPAERLATIIDKDWESAWHDSVRVFDGVISKVLAA